MSPSGREKTATSVVRLLKQNRELQELNEMLTMQNRALLEEIEQLKKQLSEKQFTEPVKEGHQTLSFRMATILFIEIIGFRDITTVENSQALIDQLDDIKRHFDSIIEKYNIRKIRTIGDSIMCVGGIPVKNITNPLDVVMAALEMSYYMSEVQGSKKIWNVRMGIHTGPVTVEMSDDQKTLYDLKGETINITSRLQASTEPGKIIVSAMTYELVKDFFKTSYYAKMPVKFLGQLGMYEVLGLQDELTEDKISPNKKFKIRYCLRQFTDLQEIILDKLEKELPSYLYYHNVKHTVDVVTEAELIGIAEGINEEELLLLKTAALFHDVGHIKGYDNHEQYSTEIAREILPAYHYTPEQIDKICELIMATKMPVKPKNLLEEIICDSDLDYLGRPDFIPVSNDLYRELKEQNKVGSLNEWNKMQIKFISGHKYYTKTARMLREVNKSIQIERLSRLITPEEPAGKAT